MLEKDAAIKYCRFVTTRFRVPIFLAPDWSEDPQQHWVNLKHILAKDWCANNVDVDQQITRKLSFTVANWNGNWQPVTKAEVFIYPQFTLFSTKILNVCAAIAAKPHLFYQLRLWQIFFLPHWKNHFLFIPAPTHVLIIQDLKTNMVGKFVENLMQLKLGGNPNNLNFDFHTIVKVL